MSNDLQKINYEVLQGDDLIIMLEFSLDDEGTEIPYSDISDDYDEIRLEVKMFAFQEPQLLLSTTDGTLNFFDQIMTGHIPAAFTRNIWYPMTGFLKFNRDGITITHALLIIYPKRTSGGVL